MQRSILPPAGSMTAYFRAVPISGSSSRGDDNISGGKALMNRTD
jgi:hypothetical protein